MDAEKRKRLEQKRAALHDKLAHQIEGTIIPRLTERGVPHEPYFGGIWTPAYIAVAGNNLWWPASPKPVEEDWCSFADRDDPDGSKTIELRQQVIAGMLDRATGPDTAVCFGYDTGDTSVVLKAGDAIANLDLLLDSRWTIWITSRAENWLIELSRDNIARLAMPPQITAMEETRAAAKLRQWTAPLADELEAHGVPFTVIRDHDPAKPDTLLRGRNWNWSKMEKSLKKIVDQGDVAGLRDIILDYLSPRVPQDEEVALGLGYVGSWQDREGSPHILLPLAALATHFDAVIAMSYREVEEKPLGPLEISAFHIRDLAGEWMMYIRLDFKYWRAEAIG